LDNRRLGVTDHELLRSRLGFPKITEAIGRIPAPVHSSLARSKEPSPSGPFFNQCPLILGKDSLDLEEHLFFGTLAEGMVQKADLTARALELFKHYDLVGIMARQPVWGVNQHDIEGPFVYQIAEAVQGGTVQRGATIPIINKEKLRGQIVPTVLRSFLLGIQLAGNGLLFLLTIGGDSRIGCSQLHS
jgi:hypothetical protein